MFKRVYGLRQSRTGDRFLVPTVDSGSRQFQTVSIGLIRCLDCPSTWYKLGHSLARVHLIQTEKTEAQQQSKILKRRAYTVPEIAVQLGRSRHTVYRLIHQGALRPLPIDGDILISEHEFEKFLRSTREDV